MQIPPNKLLLGLKFRTAGRERSESEPNWDLWEVMRLWGKTHRLAWGHGAEGADAVGVCDHHGRRKAWWVGVLWGLLLVGIHWKRIWTIIILKQLKLLNRGVWSSADFTFCFYWQRIIWKQAPIIEFWKRKADPWGHYRVNLYLQSLHW